MTRQEDFHRILAATLEDERLSRSEAKALRQVVRDHAEDRAALAILRRTAFDLAEGRIRERPEASLAWLRSVDRVIDNAVERTAAFDRVDDVAFCPGDACRRLVKGHLQSARRTLDICVFTITDNRIVDGILDAHRRGVVVRIISDDEKKYDEGSDIHRLREAGIETREDRTENHMHHKFAVVDGGLALHGSFNWTRQASWNHESLHATNAPAVVRSFRDHFDTLWRALGPLR